jgi:opacity protein-like surface antigen
MKPIFISLIVILTIIMLSIVSFAQDVSLKKRSALELEIGFWGGAKASNTITTNGIQSEAKTNGFIGNIIYSYWIQEQLSITLSAGFLAGEVSSNVSLSSVNQHSSAIIPVLIGVNYYFLNPTQEDAVRPFLSAAIGPYIGSETNNTILSQSTHSETALGGRLGAGIDFLLSNHIKLGANVRYNLMSDFSNPIGARSNYNGADFSIGIGYIF